MEGNSEIFVQLKDFRVHNYFVPPDKDEDINCFCWKLRDEIDKWLLIPDKTFQKRKKGFQDTDKNLWATMADL